MDEVHVIIIPHVPSGVLDILDGGNVSIIIRTDLQGSLFCSLVEQISTVPEVNPPSDIRHRARKVQNYCNLVRSSSQEECSYPSLYTPSLELSSYYVFFIGLTESSPHTLQLCPRFLSPPRAVSG